VRPRREQLRDDGRLEALLDEAECGAKAGAAGTDDDGVVLVIDDCKKKRVHVHVQLPKQGSHFCF
jgi:hypothetical protein